MNGELVPMNGNGGAREGAMIREEYGATEITQQVETAATAMAAHARAMTEARFVLALRRPRDWLAVRSRLLTECDRLGFAQSAIYSKPVGNQRIEGLSVRFAEAAIRVMTNLAPEEHVIYDDAQKRIVSVCLTDIEANVTYSKEITISKTVERSKVKENQTVISTRTNSHGRKTYLVQATDDDLANKEAALCSKARRNQALAILPGDIREECLARIRATIRKGDAVDPEATRKRLVDSFMASGVKPEMLREYLGHPIDQATPDEISDLRAIWVALRDGEATWGDVMEERRATAEATKGDAPAASASGEAPTTTTGSEARGTASLKRKIQPPAAAASAKQQSELPGAGERTPGEEG